MPVKFQNEKRSEMNKKLLLFFPYIAPAIGVIILLIIVYLVYNNLTKNSKRDDTLNNDIDENKLTYLKSQYLVFADTIETAIAGYGTDEQTIYNVFSQLENDNDVLELIQAFGKRWIINGLSLYYDASLPELLSYELTNEERSKLNQILSNKGIKTKF
jgi:hypothetical protein